MQHFSDISPRHCESIPAALIVLMRQDGAADDRQVRVGADRIVREQFNELQKPDECLTVNFHRPVFIRKDDAVLIVVYIGRVLQIPGLPAQSEGNVADCLPRGVIETSRVTLV